MSMYQKKREGQGVWPALVIFNVLGLGLSAILGFSYLAWPQLTKLTHAQDHETALPWITSEKDCEGESRLWVDEACWDVEHDASF